MNTKDINFAYRVRHALNEHVDSLPTPALDRLAAARAMALERKKPESASRLQVMQPKLAGGVFGASRSWFGRAAMAVPMIIAVVGIFAIYQQEYQQRISDVAEIDAMVLADELPLSAYLDKGFNAWLAKRAE